MKKTHKAVLKEYGYNLDCQGFVYFDDLVDDVRGLLNDGLEDDEIRELLPRYELEYYHFYYEVGRREYSIDLNTFCISHLHNNQNDLPNMDTHGTIIFFSKVFNQMDENLKNSKRHVKKKVV